ncbi:MAG: hypothetical protein JXR37_19135 [Kiritimatiellae bacterium]|nr:hypothetical protein [Kiritimatiellia bacterium]
MKMRRVERLFAITVLTVLIVTGLPVTSSFRFVGDCRASAGAALEGGDTSVTRNATAPPKNNAPFPGARLLFNSGFEPGTRVVNMDQKRDKIIGIDHSVSPPNDWDKLPGSLIAYEVGMSEDIRGRIIKEPGTDNHVLSFYARKSLAHKTRVQVNVADGIVGSEFTYRIKMWIHPDFNLLKDYEEAFNWLTIAEFWNNEPWGNTRYPFRVTAGIRKTAAGKVDEFYFSANAQDMEVDSRGYPTARTRMKKTTLWRQTSTVPVPIGEWFELEYYLKEGNEKTGRFVLSMTRQGGPGQAVLDVTDWTQHTRATYTDGFQAIDPLKMYTDNRLTDHIRDRGGALQFYWDDLQLFAGDARAGLNADRMPK